MNEIAVHCRHLAPQTSCQPCACRYFGTNYQVMWPFNISGVYVAHIDTSGITNAPKERPSTATANHTFPPLLSPIHYQAPRLWFNNISPNLTKQKERAHT